jgi:hypothetical protein
MYQNPTQPTDTNFFMITFNAFGPNYGYFYPSNFSAANMVLDFTDFTGKFRFMFVPFFFIEF